MSICLRSIRKHSGEYNLEIIVVDNGSKGASLEYLRSLEWIHLIERPEESPVNWPLNAFTAWDMGIQQATGDYFVTMHSDVFVKSDDWLDPFLERIDGHEEIVGVGAWKLNLESPLWAFQKRLFGVITSSIKTALGKKKRVIWREGHYPRDYCALYRRKAIIGHDLMFHPKGYRGGGYAVAKRLWEAGYKTAMIPVHELASKMVHIAHGTAGLSPKKRLGQRSKQTQTELKARKIISEPWVKALEQDSSLDF